MVSPIDYRPPEVLTISKEYPYLKDIKVDIRGLGFPAYLSPHALHDSASRLGMFSKHFQQAVVIKGSEFTKTPTGWEIDLGDYTFDNSRRSDDGQILAVIPKYNLMHKGAKTPYYTVIYKREKDGVIDCFTLDRYTTLTDGWGYPNVWHPRLNEIVSEGTYLSKDEILSHTPNKKGSLYGTSCNLKVAYLSDPDVKEDGAIISESAALKLGSWSITDVLANVRRDYIPLNTYGTKEEPKFFPNIGEKIRSDGIVCAFRPVTVERFAGDAAPEALSDVDPSADIIFIGPQNGTIIDVDFLVNRQQRQQAYPQVRMYQDALTKYYREILNLYNKWSHSHHFSNPMLTLTRDAIVMLSGLGVDVPGIKLPASAPIKDKKHQIVDFIQMKFKCLADMPFKRGSKLSDFQGGKATCAGIRKDEDMPVDAFGNRADLIMEPNTTVKRTNYGAFYEPTENYIADFVWRIAKSYYDKGDIDTAFDIIVDISRDFHPSYADLIVEILGEQKEKFVKDTMDAGYIMLNIIPGLRTINTTNIKRICDKWNITISPVSFNWPDGKGGKRRVTTTTPCVIGSKGIIRLCKEAVGMSAGIAAVSHYGTPTRPHQSKKYGSILRQTPVRWGEDENNIITMAAPIDEVLRLQRLISKSWAGTNRMIEEIVSSKHPTQIERISITNEELCQTDTIVGQFDQLNVVCDVDANNTAITKEEFEMRKNLPDIEIMSRAKQRKLNKQ